MQTIDLFAGCGGLSLGLQRSGFEIVAAFENWVPAIEVYRDNFKHPMIELDLGGDLDFSLFNKLQPTAIVGGTPCQDFSSAGKRDENLGKANLTLSFANIIATIRPSWFVLENVARAKTSKTVQTALEILRKSGYGLTQKILDASYCGVPQGRKRYFLIGELGGKDDALEIYLEKNLSQKAMTIADYLGDSLGLEFYYRHPRTYARRGIFSIYEPSPTIRGVNRPVPKTYKKHPGDACDPNENLRPLTTIERSYLQTFPRDFKFRGNKSVLEQMIGNAVPVNLSEYVGRCILEYIQDKTHPKMEKVLSRSQHQQIGEVVVADNQRGLYAVHDL
jgi:DNA (cytosine-5)-methyltransferase 1